ncbi:hypothetical protein [Bacillus marinisedimentorum]|uniref:hypothetical protein n=1 Tax=Bacillus marinisedimentorum TaxID=1821260 RepID=UPI000871DFC9|nr:hypothetical protein [Bacillus marinisedimentorum]
MNYSAALTAYTDLKAIQRLILNIQKNSTFWGVHGFSILRSVCIILDEIFKEFFHDTLPKENEEKITQIRNTVHLFVKGKGKNKIVLDKVLKYHINAFGEDTNNIGFYMDRSKRVVGSTLFSTFILMNTDLLPNPNIKSEKESGEKMFEFAKYLGELSVVLSNYLENEILYSINFNIDEVINKENLETKDVNYKYLFKSEDGKQNIFKIRLIFNLQEITDFLWLKEKYYDYLSNKELIDEYLLLRIAAIKIDEVMDNLFNLQNFFRKEFNHWNSCSENKISLLLKIYNERFEKEFCKLRNMLHYNMESTDPTKNFLGYINKQTRDKPEYINFMINTALNDFFIPLYNEIEEYLNISNIYTIPKWKILIGRLMK